MTTSHRLEPGQPVCLADLTTKGKEIHPNRAEAKEEFHAIREELVDLQHRFYADGRYKLLIVLQALDAGGKDSTIRNVFRGVNPQGVRVWSFKKPTPEELAHDFLWRVHNVVPAAGMIGVFNRSHYEDVLVARVENLVPEKVWRVRYEQINQFEQLLADTGTRILKFFLHISKKEQRKRLQKRLTDPQKNWKFKLEDLKKRADWDAYIEAFEEALARCGTIRAPWYVIPADQRWYRNLAICKTIVAALKEIDPQYPCAEEGVENIVLE